MALIIMLFALPVGIAFYSYVAQTMKSSMQEKRQKTAVQLATNVVSDYMRQFSQSVYEGHYDTSTLARPEMFYSAGYSTVTFTPDSVNRTLYIKAVGHAGSGAATSAERKLEALIQFSSDLSQYGTMINGPFTISASNARYNGGLWFAGNLSITGSNVRFNGGPLVVNGNISGSAGTVVDGDVYYSGTGIGSITVLGNVYNYVPSVNWPSIDFNYYDAHYSYKTTSNKTITFNSNGTFTITSGPTYAIPSDGVIIYGENCNLTIKGVVNGRATVVAYGTAGSSSQGNITVSDNLYYAGTSSVTASSANSFSALARNSISFSKSSGDMIVAGVYFVEQGTNNMSISGGGSAKFSLFGSRTQGISISGFGGGTSLIYDSNLLAYPSPGLPEKAMLINWRLK